MPFIGSTVEERKREIPDPSGATIPAEVLEAMWNLDVRCRRVEDPELVDGDRWLRYGKLKFEFRKDGSVKVFYGDICVMWVSIGSFLVFANTLHDYTHNAFYEPIVARKRLEREVGEK